MTKQTKVKKIAILGAGPSGLFLYKRLLESGNKKIEISIFEKSHQLGAGMPYSTSGANVEHITNVSDNEIPALVSTIEEWVKTAPSSILDRFQITAQNFNEYKVLPRLFFGAYLAAQFDLLLAKAKKIGAVTDLYLGTTIVDIIDNPKKNKVTIHTENDAFEFDQVVICTGHYWPKENEGKVNGYFDSPYPPKKLNLKLNHAVAIKGSSLTAIDAIKTLAHCNGTFYTDDQGYTTFHLAEGSEQFKLVMHSRNGLLPAVRFHLEDSHLSSSSLLNEEELKRHKDANNGFLSLDFLFEKNFKEIFRDKDPEFYKKIRSLNLEDFVTLVMDSREKLDPFQLLYAEYKEAEKSFSKKESIYWKEMLAILSFSMNYPAKYLSAEDSLRLQQVLMPLIAIVIAFIPQGSCRELMALHQAGVIDLVAVGDESEVQPSSEGAIYRYKDENNQVKEVHFKTFINCVGQPHLSFAQFPFKSLQASKSISPARLKFKDRAKAIKEIAEGNKKIEVIGDDYYLRVPGIAINDFYQLIDEYGAYNDRIFMMAVPYIGGFNPDYSGLDFCAAASAKIVKKMAD